MTRTSFGVLITRLAESSVTFSERELLEPTHWSLGEDARLREDVRFRRTPWGRWTLAEHLVANDAVYRWLHAHKRASVALDVALDHASEVFGRRCVFCADDPRFVVRNGEVHLAASELSRQPAVEDEVGDLEKYRTHLPLHSLRAAAASEPAGEWGTRAQDEVIEPLGWVRVTLPGRRLNDRMFIAAIEGHSMDDGRSGLVDGGYAVFELWPEGTRQNLHVLVRGAFSDPETGNYAVKKYVADQRDEDGRHHNVSLVSLNSDKERYPNIDLQPESDDDITVVAKVVQPLTTDDYERRPRAKRQPGRRTLTNDEQTARLGRQLTRFFDGSPPDADGEDTSASESTGWSAQLVCLEAAAGGPHVEVGPLDGLPSFVRKLRIVGAQDWDAFVLAANARTRGARVAVHPGKGPWRWEAVGFEDEQDLGLERLARAAVGETAPLVFRVDADGVGRHTKSSTLSLGQEYRLLLPPRVGDELGTELTEGWRMWSIDLSAPLSAPLLQMLRSLGLDVGEPRPRLDWALAPAAQWRANTRGNVYPVFLAGTELFVNVRGVLLDDGDEAALFLHGPAGTERLPLASTGLVALGVLGVGRWTCSLLHSRTTVQPTASFFEVADGALEEVAASCSAVAHSGLESLEAASPPGWPVTLRWRVFASHEETLASVFGSEDGTIPIDSVATVIEARAARTRIADLIVDFGELGRRVLEHDGRPSLKQVREQLTALWQQRAGLVQSRRGAWLQLRKPWLEPITELFGYGLADLPQLTDIDAPYDLTAWGLTVDERKMGNITRSLSRVLVLTTDIDAVLRDHRAWIDSACAAADVRDAIITDGGRWTTHRKGSHQLRQQVWAFEEAVNQNTIDEMLSDLAEGL